MLRSSVIYSKLIEQAVEKILKVSKVSTDNPNRATCSMFGLVRWRNGGGYCMEIVTVVMVAMMFD